MWMNVKKRLYLPSCNIQERAMLVLSRLKIYFIQFAFEIIFLALITSASSLFQFSILLYGKLYFFVFLACSFFQLLISHCISVVPGGGLRGGRGLGGGGCQVASGQVYQPKVPRSSLGTGWPLFFITTAHRVAWDHPHAAITPSLPGLQRYMR